MAAIFLESDILKASGNKKKLEPFFHFKKKIKVSDSIFFYLFDDLRSKSPLKVT